jgi:hypothetical protein
MPKPLSALLALVLTAPAPARPAKGGIPAGTYTTTIVVADVPASFPRAERDSTVGRWDVAFNGATRVRVDYNGQRVVNGRYTSTATRARFGHDTGRFACHTPGTYEWSRHGNALTFRAIHDTCLGRRVVLTTHPLTRK